MALVVVIGVGLNEAAVVVVVEVGLRVPEVSPVCIGIGVRPGVARPAVENIVPGKVEEELGKTVGDITMLVD